MGTGKPMGISHCTTCVPVVTHTHYHASFQHGITFTSNSATYPYLNTDSPFIHDFIFHPTAINHMSIQMTSSPYSRTPLT